ncbi:MAG: methyltransferase [Fimbriimonadales bacterium]
MSELLLSTYQARPLLAKRLVELPRKAMSSADLNLTKVEVELTEEGVQFPDQIVPWPLLERVATEDRKVFSVRDGAAKALQVFSGTTGWVRSLCPTESAPTVLVSGIPMHRIKGTDPVKDTREKMKALGIQKGRVLDTATGLGYTAIAAARTAKEVVTIEVDASAIDLARLNPWSRELFARPNIHQIIGDAAEEIAEMPRGLFSAVIHDPPTMVLGGELYSGEFYCELHRVLNRGGKLFHYICDPDSGIGKRMWPGVIKRLGEAGFRRIERHPEAFGVIAERGT